MRLKSAFVVFCCFVLMLFAGCTSSEVPESDISVSPTSQTQQIISVPIVQETVAPTETSSSNTPKYVFLFIGDGMSFSQVNAAQIYKGSIQGDVIQTESLSFTQFPTTGMVTTYNADSYCPDSASAGTALSCGIKTLSGVLGLEADATTSVQNITEILQAAGWKIGILSTVPMNHATPAAFYAHTDSRGNYYEIAMQMAQSGVDYFGGGALIDPTDGDKDAFDVLEQNGYTIADTKEEIEALQSGDGKVYAISPTLLSGGSMPFEMDAQENDLTLADFVDKGIDVLDNETGFFMMCESGMIDWACHANDAMASISETLVLEDAVQVAVDFAQEHPEETLIIVTADHETGGMALGYTETGYDTHFELLAGQKMSYSAFGRLFSEMKETDPNLMMNDVLPVIKENFGLITPDDADAPLAENADRVLTADEYDKIATALSASLNGAPDTDESDLLYGGYDPLTVTLTHILDNKAGIGWTTFAHTGGLVPVYAYGAYAEVFEGSYDNTDIFKKLVEICGR